MTLFVVITALRRPSDHPSYPAADLGFMEASIPSRVAESGRIVDG